MRKNSTVFTLLLVALGLSAALLVSRPASAQDSGFGLGFVLGDPNGLAFKAYVGPSAAIDGGIGWGIINHGHLQAYLDFLWEWRVASWDAANLALYVGVGPKIGKFWEPDLFRIGARAPLGLAFQFNRVPLDLFLEVAAGLWFYEDSDFDIDAGLGLRFWF